MLKLKKPRILGIVNITEDSFSDGGRFLNSQSAIDHAHALKQSGADIIDLGPASSNPDAKHVSADLEIERLTPVVSKLTSSGIEVSIDSFQPQTQLWGIASRVNYLNDIEGFANHEIYPQLSDADCQLFLMHSIQRRGIATRVNAEPALILDEISIFFEQRIKELQAAGISSDRIILDPGMGFFLGTNEATSVKVLQNLEHIKHQFDLPLLISVSRKSFLRKIAGRSVTESNSATLAAEIFAAMNGADYIRTHDTGALMDAITILSKLYGNT
jgi:dihydropteroate synthase